MTLYNVMVLRKDELSEKAFPLALKGGFFYIKLISTPFSPEASGGEMEIGVILILYATHNKLLKQEFAIVKSERPYDENYISSLA